jgi:hypothetical protein
MIYLLTEIGLSPGDSTHLHTIHRTTQITTPFVYFYFFTVHVAITRIKNQLMHN